MLKRLESADPRFRTVRFRPGLNLLLADRTDRSAHTDTRNSVGKSSMVEVLHFLLGGRADKGSPMARKPLSGMRFALSMDWPAVQGGLRTERDTSKPASVQVDPDIVAAPGAGGRGHPGGPVRIPLAQWQHCIERDLFRLPDDHKGISGRALLSFYLRRVGDHAFNEATRTFPQQSAAEGTTNLAHLLGLDWTLVSGYRDIAAKESMRRKLREAAKDPVFGRIVGRPSELRGQITVLENRQRELGEEIAAFVIVPEFEALQRRADELGRAMVDSRASDAVARRNLQDIDDALAPAVEPDPSYLRAAYAELGDVVGDRIRRRLDEVEAFHASVMANRRRYLQQERERTVEELEARRLEREAWCREQAEVLRTLDNGGALDALKHLQERYAKAAAELEALRARYEAADALESSRAEIAQERGRLQQAVAADLRDRSDAVDGAVLLYSEYASSLYGAKYPSYLEFSADPGSLRITPRIESDEGRGVGNMAIFCFDLTVAVVAHRHGRGPDFLVHDSHLFDGVDERQILRALVLAGRVAREEGLQYVATMNSDDLAKARGVGTAAEAAVLDEAVIEPRLTDAAPSGGLFGFRF